MRQGEGENIMIIKAVISRQLVHVIFRVNRDTIFIPDFEELRDAMVSNKKRIRISQQHTVFRWLAISCVVSSGAVAKGIRSHESRLLWRLLAGLSPIAFFLPMTHFKHFLQGNGKWRSQGPIGQTYSSERPYKVLRCPFKSMIIAITTEQRSSGNLSSDCHEGFEANRARNGWKGVRLHILETHTSVWRDQVPRLDLSIRHLYISRIRMYGLMQLSE